jgi:hypothetical protein
MDDRMNHDGDGGGAAMGLLDRDEVEGVLSGAFYTPRASSGVKPKAAPVEKPSHYKVICISMYTDDLGRLDEMVDMLKARGMTKANRSALIRHALEQVDLDKVPRGI